VGAFSSMSFSSCCNLGFFVLCSLHLLLFSFSLTTLVLLFVKRAYTTPLHSFLHVGNSRKSITWQNFSHYIFFTSFVFFLMSFDPFLKINFLVCGARLVINFFGNKHKPFEKYFLQFCPCKCFESFLIVHRNY
jgi:hypothetical protein